MAVIARSIAALRVITNEKRAMSDTRRHHRAVAVGRIAPDQNLAAGSGRERGGDRPGGRARRAPRAVATPSATVAPARCHALARPARSRSPAITGAEPGVLIVVASGENP